MFEKLHENSTVDISTPREQIYAFINTTYHAIFGATWSWLNRPSTHNMQHSITQPYIGHVP